MTTHRILTANSNNMTLLSDQSVNLIVTSPPYPMIEMWDHTFSEQDPTIGEYLRDENGYGAFEKMHSILNSVWKECDRVLKNNGFICINIGDATRTIRGNFQLYPNHSKVIDYFSSLGYSVLPDIHWRKQSNAPNKFMGSGMYPAGAYVTYEHEYILVVRKGGKRVFLGKEKETRQKSAFFWEERNTWFSDLWDIKGAPQSIVSSKLARNRSASFPLEIPYRLVNMYSVKGDTVLDPFLGLGTTSIACMLSNRNSIGLEIDPEIVRLAIDNLNLSAASANRYIEARIQNHLDFMNALPQEKRKRCYQNRTHGFLVKTRQERAIEIEAIDTIEKVGDGYNCRYKLYDKGVGYGNL